MKATKRCPIDFLITEDMRIWAEAKVPGVDIDYETEKFVDCTFKVARKDWPATWRNWMRGAQERIDEKQCRQDFYAGKLQRPRTIEQDSRQVEDLRIICGLPIGADREQIIAANDRRIARLQ